MLDAYPKLQRKNLKYFRTLHSLAFNRLGMKKSEVMQDEHYEDIGRKLGIEMTVYSNGQETTGFVDSNSEYFKLPCPITWTMKDAESQATGGVTAFAVAKFKNMSTDNWPRIFEFGIPGTGTSTETK